MITCYHTTVSKVPQSKPAQDDHPYSVGCPVHLLQYDWFHGKLSQEEANKLLTAMGGTCFLVREERKKAGTLVLSVKDKSEVNHFPINRGPGWYEVTGTAHRFDTVWELVTYYKTNSLSGYSQLTLGSSCGREMEPVSGIYNSLCTFLLIHVRNTVRRGLGLGYTNLYV